MLLMDENVNSNVHLFQRWENFAEFKHNQFGIQVIITEMLNDDVPAILLQKAVIFKSFLFKFRSHFLKTESHMYSTLIKRHKNRSVQWKSNIHISFLWREKNDIILRPVLSCVKREFRLFINRNIFGLPSIFKAITKIDKRKNQRIFQMFSPSKRPN